MLCRSRHVKSGKIWSLELSHEIGTTLGYKSIGCFVQTSDMRHDLDNQNSVYKSALIRPESMGL